MNILCVPAVLILLAGLGSAADELAVLTGREELNAPAHMMTGYLNRLADEALKQRAVAREALKTEDDVLKYQEEMRAFFVNELGGLPERTPLNARTVDARMRDGYRSEKIIYESRPKLFVTAVLFLPMTAPPYPGVLVPCGHSANGKVNEVYQRACIFLARNGIAALIYDPIGQGERYQFLDANGKPRFGSTTEHTILGVGCILLGTNTAAYRIWDGMRGIDYLASRPEIDPKRIGCTGNSGGGTLTCYLMALDTRIQCAAPGCYVTSFARLLDTAGPQDAEQNIHGQIARGMDHADYILMRAPKPTLLCCARKDFFDIQGAWDTFREAKQLYTKLGFPERIDLVEADEEHGFSAPLRQGMVRWMRRWLKGADDPVMEPEFPALSEHEMQCTPDGQVLRMPGARSILDFNIELEKRLATQRRSLWKSLGKQAALEKVRTLAGIRPLAELPEPKVETVGVLERDTYRIEKLLIEPEPGIEIPALLYVPAHPDANAYLYAHEAGKAAVAQPGGALEHLAHKGHLVLAPDLRGMGETAATDNDKGWQDRFGGGWKDYFRAYLLNKTYVGMRAEDLLVCARFLVSAHAPKSPRKIHLIAVGETGVPALHAAALESGTFASLEIERCVRSWAEVVRAPLAERQLMNAVHGALRVYDLPDLVATLPRSKVRARDPLTLVESERTLH